MAFHLVRAATVAKTDDISAVVIEKLLFSFKTFKVLMRKKNLTPIDWNARVLLDVELCMLYISLG